MESIIDGIYRTSCSNPVNPVPRKRYLRKIDQTNKAVDISVQVWKASTGSV